MIKAIGFNGEGEGAQRVVASKGVGLLDRVGTSIKALDINLAVSIGREIPGIFAEGTVLLDILSASALVGTRGLDGELYALELGGLVSRVLLNELERVSVVTDGIGHGLALAVAHGIVEVDELDAVGITLAANHDILRLLVVKLGGVGDDDMGILGKRLAHGPSSSLKIRKGNSQHLPSYSPGLVRSIRDTRGVVVDRRHGFVINLNGNRILIRGQTRGELVVELIVVGVERIDVRSHSTGQLVVHGLIHLGVALVSPVAVELVILDLLRNRGNASLLGHGYSSTTYDGENRRGARLFLVGIVFIRTDGVIICQEEIVASALRRKRITSIERRT